MAMGLAGLVSGRRAASKFGKGARKADMPNTPKIGNNINDTIALKHGKISSSDIDVKTPIDEVVTKPKIENVSNEIDNASIKQPSQKADAKTDVDIDVKKSIDEVVVKPKNDTDISNKTNDIVKPKIESVELIKSNPKISELLKKHKLTVDEMDSINKRAGDKSDNAIRPSPEEIE